MFYAVLVRCLESGVIEWRELAKATRAKFRKMINEGTGYDNSLSVELVNVLFENLERLQKELQNILDNFGIAD